MSVKENSYKHVHFWVNDLFGRTLVFTLFVLTICFLLYLLGSFQEFLDSTQFFLMKIVDTAALLFLFLSLFFLIGRIIEWIFNRERHIRDLIFTLFGILCVAVIYFFVELILVVAG